MPVTISWNEENTAALVSAYTGDNSTAALAAIGESLGNKTVPMVRSKLVALKVYRKGTPVMSKSSAISGLPVRKCKIVENISSILDTQGLHSLEKGSKSDLLELQGAILKLSQAHAAQLEEEES